MSALTCVYARCKRPVTWSVESLWSGRVHGCCDQHMTPGMAVNVGYVVPRTGRTVLYYRATALTPTARALNTRLSDMVANKMAKRAAR